MPGSVAAGVPGRSEKGKAWTFEKLSRLSPVALATAKETIRRGLEIQDVTEATKMEAEQWRGMFATHDQKEGMTAFIEKRPAVYTGT